MAVTVLIVDDDVTLRWVLSKQLDKFGLQADSAANGKEAFERVKRWPYQVILMDVQMPEMSGYEATRLIRMREKELDQERTPIIAITASESREKCLAAGMDDYMEKPVDAAGLQAMLHKWMKPGSCPPPLMTTGRKAGWRDLKSPRKWSKPGNAQPVSFQG